MRGRGWPVLPIYEPDQGGHCTCNLGASCRHPAKHPRTPHGFKDATTDESQILQWWTRWKNANVAVSTGPPSDLVVVDVDSRHGGDESLVRLAADAGPIPETLTSRTGGGGQHILFAGPEVPLGSRTNVLAGIDVRAEGAYSIMPPSRHASGQKYEWIGDSAKGSLAQLPERLSRLFTEPKRLAVTHETDQEFYEEGQRNESLFRQGSLMRRLGLSHGAIEDELLAINDRRCSPPLGENEVTQIASSAARYAVADQPSVARIHSAPYRKSVEAESIRFRTTAQIENDTPERPLWIAKPWVAAKAVTALDGKPKAAGKTTWLLRLIGCVLDAESFMGEPTTKTSVVYLTEEGEATFREALDRAGLLGRHDLHVLHRGDAWSVPWPGVISAAVKKCQEVGAGLLVIDTVAPFAGLKGDKENNAGDQQEAFEPLAWARDQGLAVIANRHERKSSGDVGDSARGSNAFTAAADVIISIRRPEGNCKPTIREIHALSRFSETPDKLIVELTEDGYEIRDSAAVSVGQAEDAILKAAPMSAQDALTVDDLLTTSGVARTTAQKAIRNLVGRGQLEETGGGVKNDPRRYHRPIHSATTPFPIEAERIQRDDSMALVRPATTLHLAETAEVEHAT